MTSPFPKAQARHFGEPEVATRSYTYVLPSWAQGCGGCVALPPSGVLLFWRFGTVVLQRGAAGQAKPAWQAKPVAAGTSWSSCAAATRRISCSAVTGTRHDRTPPGTGGRSRPVAAGVGDRAGPQRAGDVARHARLDPRPGLWRDRRGDRRGRLRQRRDAGPAAVAFPGRRPGAQSRGHHPLGSQPRAATRIRRCPRTISPKRCVRCCAPGPPMSAGACARWGRPRSGARWRS